MRKKCLKLILSFVTMVSSVLFLKDQTVEVKAMNDGYYPMACNAFEVAKLKSDGTFETIACKNTMDEAKPIMYGLGDAGVIRHPASKSPTKIVQATNGIVYSYPQRSNKNTANLTQYLNGGGKKTYVTVHRPLAYLGTYTYDESNGNGRILANINGFEGYMDLSECDIIPLFAVTNNIPLWLGGEEAYKWEKPFKTIPVQPYFEVKQNGNYTDLVYNWAVGWSGKEDTNINPRIHQHAVGPAASWMSVGSRYYSKDGYTFFSDREYRNQVGVYYNYYQFLPNRSKTKLPAWAMDNYLDQKGISGKMNGTGQMFIDAQNEYGVNALTVFALGCLESNYGRSNFARERNNLFGVAAYDSDPNRATYFDSIKGCVDAEMGGLLRGFMCSNDWRYFGQHLGNKGSGFNVKYAGDPFWGIKIASIAYEIDKSANGYNGQLTDFNQVAMGMISNDKHTNIFKSPNGAQMIHTHYSTDYQKNNIMPLIGESDGWYQVQANDVLDGSSNPMMNLIAGTIMPYDWNHNIGWLNKNEVTKLNSAALVSVDDQPTGEFVHKVNSLTLNDNGTVSLSGVAYRPGIRITDSNTAKLTLKLKDFMFNVAKEIPLDVKVEDGMKAVYSTNINLKDLAKNYYFMEVSLQYSKHSQYNETFYIDSKIDQAAYRYYDGYEYKFSETAVGDTTHTLLVKKSIKPGTGAIYNKDTNTCECKAGYENWQYGKGCQLIPEKPKEIEKKLIAGVLDTKYSDDHTKLTIDGLSYIQGMDAKNGQNIQKKLYLVDLSNEENKIEVPTESIDLYGPMDFNDGFVYEDVYFKATIDLDKMEAGSYYLQCVVTNGDVTYDAKLITPEYDFNKLEKLTDQAYLKTHVNNFKGLRFELEKLNSSIDYSAVKRNTKRDSVYYDAEPVEQEAKKAMTLENGILTMDAYSFSYYANFNAKTKPTYRVLFEDETGNLFEFDAKTKDACKIDFTPLIHKGKYDLSSACFVATCDLNELPSGIYRMYVEIKTNEIFDIFPISNNIMDYVLPTESNVNGKSFTLLRAKGTGYFNLIVNETVEQKALQARSVDEGSEASLEDETQVESSEQEESEETNDQEVSDVQTEETENVE